MSQTDLEYRRIHNLAEKEAGYKVLRKLYKAISDGDVEAVKALVAADIEWWFHGPRFEQHLMRMLTGIDRLGLISFKPSRVCYVKGKFLTEGFLGASTCWVHVFTIKSGKVTELREYFNTSVTVTCAGLCSSNPLWQSQVSEHGTPMPELIVVCVV